jgi:hypothetical protein
MRTGSMIPIYGKPGSAGVTHRGVGALRKVTKVLLEKVQTAPLDGR